MTAIVSVRTGLRLVTKDSDAKPTSSVFLCFSWVSACQTGYTCYWEHVIVMLCKVVWASQYCLLTLQHREDCCSLAVPKCADRSDKRSVPFQVECHVCSFCWKTVTMTQLFDMYHLSSLESSLEFKEHSDL